MSERHLKLTLLLILLLSLFFFFGGDQGTQLTVSKMKNAHYTSDDFQFQLENGSYYFPMPDEEKNSEPWRIQLVQKKVSFGDLNQDGLDDAAFLLHSWTGGTGQFFDLGVSLNQNGYPQHITSIHLGDRISVNRISIKKGQILVDMITHADEDPLCCPTLHKEVRYTLSGDDLLKEKE